MGTFTVTANWGQDSLTGSVAFAPQPSGTTIGAQILGGVLCDDNGIPGLALPFDGIITGYRVSFSGVASGPVLALIPAAFIPVMPDGSTSSLTAMTGNGLVPEIPQPPIQTFRLAGKVFSGPFSIMSYRGVWDASANTPHLADGTGHAGDVYMVSVGAIRDLGSGSITFQAGEYLIYNGVSWQVPAGPPGPANTLSIGTITSGNPTAGAASITGTAPTQTLNLTVPRGYGFAGLTPASDGTHVQGLVDSATGPVPVGDPIAIGNLSYNSTVTHGTNPSYVRPPVTVAVIWIGSVQPTNAIDGDVWLDTSGTGPTISTTVLNSLNVGAAMSQMLVASGSQPVVWSLASGSNPLPTWMTLSSAGNLYGTPTGTGGYSFTVQALNAFGSATQSYSGSVGSAVGPTITTTALNPIYEGVPFSQVLSVTGSATITFVLKAGSTMPTGLSIDSSTGTISGTVVGSGSYSFIITASNGVGSFDRTLSGSVTGVSPTITTPGLNSIYRAFAFSQALSVTGSAGITFGLAPGSAALPGWLSLDSSTGILSGTPTTVSSSTFTVRASNSFGHYDKTFTASVLESTPVIVETSLNAMKVNVGFSQTLTLASGGPTITWSVPGGVLGTLPPGLSINSATGAITGTPTTPGTYIFTVRASNGAVNDDQSFTVPVANLMGYSASADSGAVSATSRSVTLSTSAGDTVLFFVHSTGSGSASATIGGSGMTQVGTTWMYGTVGAGYTQYLSVFKKENVAGGSVTITGTSTGSLAVNVAAVAYHDAPTVGSGYSQANATGTAISHTVSSSVGKRLVQFIASPNAYTISAYSQTQRLSDAPHIRMFVGDADGAASVGFTATHGTSGLWASVVLELSVP